MNNPDMIRAFEDAARHCKLAEAERLGKQLQARRVLSAGEVEQKLRGAVSTSVRKLQEAVAETRWLDASRLCSSCRPYLTKEQNRSLIDVGLLKASGCPNSPSRMVRLTALREAAHAALSAGDLERAERRMRSVDVPSFKRDFELEKRALLRAFVTEEQPHLEGDEEKVSALAATGNTILLAARAGAGKTTTLALKAASLMRHYGAQPDEILILAFNNEAATDIGGKVATLTGRPFRTAMTFHALAKRTVSSADQDIVADSSDKRVDKRERTHLVNRAFRELLDDEPPVAVQLYTFLREEVETFSKVGGRSDETYYKFRRYQKRYLALDGTIVRSKGEKWIADFLFEHGVAYHYERRYFKNGVPMHPDFTLYPSAASRQSYGKDFLAIIEHWAIDPDDPHAEVPNYFTVKTRNYRRLIEEKRLYWEGRRKPLLETSTADMRRGRKAFEGKLRDLLEQRGVPCDLRPEEERVREVVRAESSPLESTVSSLIDLAKQRGLSPQAVSARYAAWGAGRTEAFRYAAVSVLERYQDLCAAQGKIDFYDLINSFPDRVGAVWSSARLGKDGTGPRLAGVRYLLIDEYQDFSPAFHRLIASFREHSPGARLIAVGDDWQAINGFAGADLTFFREFNAYFPDGVHAGLRTNHRSGVRIVDLGNEVMRGRGPHAASDPAKGVGEVRYVWVDRVPLKFGKGEEDWRYLKPFRCGANAAAGEHLKGAYQAAYDYLSAQADVSGSSVLVLSRLNRVCGTSLSDLQNQLKRWLGEALGCAHSKIDLEVKTAHKAKGGQADLVIILQAVDGEFPFVHPLSDLLGPLGRDTRALLDEERRLFYVAVTRAKRSLRLLVRKDAPSPFLPDVGKSSGLG